MSFESHPNGRCGAMVNQSTTGRRCMNDSVPGSNPPRCEAHLAGCSTPFKFYGTRLKPALAELVSHQLENTSFLDDVSLREELALIRHAAGHAVEKYSQVCETPGATLETKALAGTMLISSMEDVIKAVEAATRVEKVKLEVSQSMGGLLAVVIQCMVEAASEVFGDDHRMRDLEQLIRGKVEARVQGLRVSDAGSTPGGPRPTDVTPDVLMMDATVPAVVGG